MKLDRGEVNFLRTSLAGWDGGTVGRCPPNGSVGGCLNVAAPWWLFQIGLSATTIASSFGKVVSQDKALEEYRPEDIALSLVRMVSYNIGQVSTRAQQRSTAIHAQFYATSIRSCLSYGIQASLLPHCSLRDSSSRNLCHLLLLRHPRRACGLPVVN